MPLKPLRARLGLERRLRTGDGMQTAALADCERLRTNRRHAHLRLIYCN